MYSFADAARAHAARFAPSLVAPLCACRQPSQAPFTSCCHLPRSLAQCCCKAVTSACAGTSLKTAQHARRGRSHMGRTVHVRCFKTKLQVHGIWRGRGRSCASSQQHAPAGRDTLTLLRRSCASPAAACLHCALAGQAWRRHHGEVHRYAQQLRAGCVPRAQRDVIIPLGAGSGRSGVGASAAVGGRNARGKQRGGARAAALSVQRAGARCGRLARTGAADVPQATRCTPAARWVAGPACR